MACFPQGVAELQQQVAELKLERSQLLKAVTESQHDAACLAEHVRQIGQLKQVLANVQQENAELSKDNKVWATLMLSICVLTRKTSSQITQ